ncbi:hypothetical protein IWQ55_000973 [Labrenzia sp. EL_208]|nr:hypothetical protein [Labrenzia sp. EL_132]MBG6227775.1 hypothetical protein [Labrenzia sp. EL_208]
MPIGSIASTQHEEWSLREKDFKTYFHFDALHDARFLQKAAQDDNFVAKHSFYPLILFKEEWTKFRECSVRRNKVRPLRYAARLDAAIYAYHRFSLSKRYEEYLEKKGISEMPIAYRKIPKGKQVGNKCNIEFAKEAFDFIRETKHCDVTIVDVSSFFESLDHQKILCAWQKVLARDLNEAESAVFRSITKYSVVDRDQLFERLGLFEFGSGINRRERRMRKIDKIRDKGDRKLCSNQEFRDLVCGGDVRKPSLIQKNNKGKGIPQGTPVSDLIANIYMIDFDLKVSRWVRKRGGKAFRYCDDIIIILPRKNGQSYEIASNYLRSLVTKNFKELKIKPEKVAIGRFIPASRELIFTHLSGPASVNGLEYLGFQFDGKVVQLKNSTMSNAWRKLKKRSHGWAKRWVRQYKLKGDAWLLENAPIDRKVTETLKDKRASKIENFGELTFRSYVERCDRVFSDYETNFKSQLRRYKRLCRKQFETALTKAIKTYG